MYIFIHLYDIGNIYSLFFILGRALVLFLGWRLSTERVVAQPLHLYLPPRCERYWWLQSCILSYDSVRWCKCTLALSLQALNYVIHCQVYM